MGFARGLVVENQHGVCRARTSMVTRGHRVHAYIWDLCGIWTYRSSMAADTAKIPDGHALVAPWRAGSLHLFRLPYVLHGHQEILQVLKRKPRKGNFENSA